MAQGKLMLNNEWNTMFQNLPDEKAGQLIKALYDCHNREEVALDDPVLFSVFLMMSETVCENADKYEEKCRKNAENRTRAKTTDDETERPSTTVNDRGQNKNIKEKDSIESKEKDLTEKESPAKAEPLMPAVQEIVKYLNDKAGTHYRHTSRETAELVKARLNDHYTIDDFKRVIDVKCAEWMGTEQQKYLRPETLFKRSHFEGYLNQPMERPPDKVTRFDRNIMQRTGSVKEENDEMVRQILAMR